MITGWGSIYFYALTTLVITFKILQGCLQPIHQLLSLHSCSSVPVFKNNWTVCQHCAVNTAHPEKARVQAEITTSRCPSPRGLRDSEKAWVARRNFRDAEGVGFPAIFLTLVIIHHPEPRSSIKCLSPSKSPMPKNKGTCR